MKKIVLKFIYNILAWYTRQYLKKTQPFVIWVTWSVWKTSCRMILYKVLQKHLSELNIYTSPKNFNSELWLIFSIFKIEEYKWGLKELIKLTRKIKKMSQDAEKVYDIIILEYGIDHPRDMDFLLSFVEPDLSVFTKLWSIHVENFWSVENIGNEKFKLIEDTLYKTYLNFDDEFLKRKYSEINIRTEFFNKCPIDFKYIKQWNTVFSKLVFDSKTIKTNILWSENFAYIQLAYFMLEDFWVVLKDFEETFDLENEAWRFNVLEWIHNSILVDSTYNAWPESMDKMIDNVITLRKRLYPDYKLWFVIWDMKELWKFSKDSHIKLSEKLKDNDLLITVWSQTKKYFSKDTINFLSSRQAWAYLKNELDKTTDKYIILFKWSQNTIFVEEALKEVLLNQDDEKKLVRQDSVWLNNKNKFFSKVK